MQVKINAQKVIDYLKENKLSKKEFCIKSKVSVKSLNKMLKGETVNVKTLFNVARGADCYIRDFFD